MTRRAHARNARNILCVAPAYAPSFGTFQYSYGLCGKRAFMPPQGLLAIAAYLPANWPVRFVDENVRKVRPAEFRWADAVFVSGMQIQRARINELADRAHAFGRTAVLGGPAVSSQPEIYAGFDYLHLGELGDATDALIARLDDDPSRPAAQVRLATAERLPLSEFPPPAYHLADLARYMLGSIQYSSGCPYRCEFCDIPALYGRNPRLKAPEQVLAELDVLCAGGAMGCVYFVDDNFVGNKKAARLLVESLIEWQKKHGYPVEFACEATLNIAYQPELLGLMQRANFRTIFCGIESPEIEALKAMDKGQNLRRPILEAVQILNTWGIEVVSGLILGLDTDGPGTADAVRSFVAASQIPMLTINLLQALPKTPLHARLAAEGRLADDPDRESNVVFRQPYEQVVETWRTLVRELYDPAALFGRFAYNARHTFPNRLPVPRQVGKRQILEGLMIIARVLLVVGLLRDYRRLFWRTAWPLLRQGRLEDLLHIGLVANHLIRFAREGAAGRQNASFYSAKTRALATGRTARAG